MIRLLYLIEVVIVAIFLFFFLTIWLMDPESKELVHIKRASRYSIIAMFTIFLFVYLSVLFILSRRLKKYFPKFFEKERLKIIFATGMIIISIVSRITVNIWYLNHLQDIEDSFNNGTWLYPIYQLITSVLATFFPLGATVGSLLYALSQKRKMFKVDSKHLS